MVDDVNDNDPIFNESSYVAHVKENSNVSTSVATVYATDQDQDENGLVSYKITSGNTGDVFEIDNQTGVVSVKGSIDREAITEYTLTIQAEDGGHPSSRKVSLKNSAILVLFYDRFVIFIAIATSITIMNIINTKSSKMEPGVAQFTSSSNTALHSVISIIIT